METKTEYYDTGIDFKWLRRSSGSLVNTVIDLQSFVFHPTNAEVKNTWYIHSLIFSASLLKAQGQFYLYLNR
jgi:hypothetical protein